MILMTTYDLHGRTDMDGAGGLWQVGGELRCAFYKVEESVHTMVHVSMVGREQYLYASREWRKQCFLRFLVRGNQPKQANTIFSTTF
jgi:hypothetical protein